MESYQYNNNPDLKSNALLSKKAATEGIVLLKNKSVLPFKNSKNVALLGVTSYDFISGGTGSGDVNEAYSISLEEGLINLNYKFIEIGNINIDKECTWEYETYKYQN
mgnify:CR=1 FL=1